MKHSLFQKYTIILVILSFDCSNLFAQWYESGQYHLYTLDRVSIGENLQNFDRQLNIYGAKTYGYQVGSYVVSDFTSGSDAFKGKAIARIADCSSYAASGMGIGITAYTSDVTKLQSSGSYASYAVGGSFGTNITNPIPSGSEPYGIYIICGVRAYLNGTISRYPTNGVVTALYAKDYIKGTKTWAGYFDGKVAVDGKIVAEEVEVVNQVPWPDFVFSDDYKLMNIEELNNYIKRNNHLPGIPTNAEIDKNGMSLGYMNSLLLQKIEELTLYIIDQNVKIKELEEEINKMKD